MFYVIIVCLGDIYLIVLLLLSQIVVRTKVLFSCLGLSSFRDRRVSGEALSVAAMTSKKLYTTWYVPKLLYKGYAIKNWIR